MIYEVLPNSKEAYKSVPSGACAPSLLIDGGPTRSYDFSSDRWQKWNGCVYLTFVSVLGSFGVIACLILGAGAP